MRRGSLRRGEGGIDRWDGTGSFSRNWVLGLPPTLLLPLSGISDIGFGTQDKVDRAGITGDGRYENMDSDLYTDRPCVADVMFVRI